MHLKRNSGQQTTIYIIYQRRGLLLRSSAQKTTVTSDERIGTSSTNTFLAEPDRSNQSYIDRSTISLPHFEPLVGNTFCCGHQFYSFAGYVRLRVVRQPFIGTKREDGRMRKRRSELALRIQDQCEIKAASIHDL